MIFLECKKTHIKDVKQKKENKVMTIFRRKAEWIYWRERGFKQCKCSNCKTSYGCIDTPYCPNCGRKMVESKKYKNI
jgi:hypothetical protein